MQWYSVAELQRMAAEGRIRRDQQFYDPRYGRWLRAETIPAVARYFRRTDWTYGRVALTAVGLALLGLTARQAERNRLGQLPWQDLRREIFRRDDYTCVYCGRRGTGLTLEVDHEIPVARGGSDEPGNLATACWQCNREKGTMTAWEYRWYRLWNG